VTADPVKGRSPGVDLHLAVPGVAARGRPGTYPNLLRSPRTGVPRPPPSGGHTRTSLRQGRDARGLGYGRRSSPRLRSLPIVAAPPEPAASPDLGVRSTIVE
jgi:hypothetical protein